VVCVNIFKKDETTVWTISIIRKTFFDSFSYNSLCFGVFSSFIF